MFVILAAINIVAILLSVFRSEIGPQFCCCSSRYAHLLGLTLFIPWHPERMHYWSQNYSFWTKHLILLTLASFEVVNDD